MHHRVCPGPLTAAVLEGRLIRAWAPPFNPQGRVPPGDPGTAPRDALPATGTADGPRRRRRPVAEAPRPRRRGRRPDWSAEDLAGDPTALLAPYAERVAELSRSPRYEDAARVRDEAERLRHLVVRHRSVESLRRAGRLVLDIEGEGTVELEDGLLAGAAPCSTTAPRRGRGGGLARRSP